MSTIVRPTPTAEDASPAPARAIAIRWIISRAALHCARPDLAGPAGPPVALEWRLEARAGSVRAQAVIVDEGRETPVASRSADASAWMRDVRGFEHIDLPGLLVASVRTGQHPPGLAYARTSLFSAWAIPGGRYECQIAFGKS